MIRKGIIAAAIAMSGGLAADNYYPDYNYYDCCQPDSVGGFYLGVGVGRAFSNAHYKQFAQLFYDDLTTLAHSEVWKYDSGGEGSTESVIFGYGRQFCNKWYLGAELFATASDLGGDLYRNDTVFFGEFNGFHKNPYRLRIEYTLGAAFTPGIYVSPESLYFLRFGWVRSKVYMDANYEMEQPFNVLNSNLPQIESFQDGFQFGVGNEIQITPCVSFRQDYAYERYGYRSDRKISPDGGNDFGTPANFDRKVTIHPSIDKFTWSLLYHFNPQSNAADYCSPLTNTGGAFYVSIGGSRNATNTWSQARLERIFRDVFAVAPNDLTTSREPTYANTQLRNFTGAIGLGYGYVFSNRLFVGGEIVGGVASGHKSKVIFQGLSGYFENWSQKFSAKDMYNIIASFRPGYQLTDKVLFFGRLGTIMNVSKVHSNVKVLGNDASFLQPQPALNAALSYKRRLYLFGFITGLGVETAITKNVTLTYEMDVTFFGKSTRTSPIFPETTSSDAFPAIDYGIDTARKTHSASILFALSYYFGHTP